MSQKSVHTVEIKIKCVTDRSPLHNECFEECGGPCDSNIVLAEKPYQEHVTNIDNFIWLMFVSYRKLNKITKPFEFSITPYENAIISVGVGSDKIILSALIPSRCFHKLQ